MVNLKSPGVCDVVQKLKGITTFLHLSGHRLTNLKGIQKRLDIEETRHQKLATPFVGATCTKVKNGFANYNRPF